MPKTDVLLTRWVPASKQGPSKLVLVTLFYVFCIRLVFVCSTHKIVSEFIVFWAVYKRNAVYDYDILCFDRATVTSNIV